MKAITTSLPKIRVSFHTLQEAQNNPIIRSSQDCYEVFKNLWNHETIELLEEFKVLYLNRANRIIGYRNLSRGSSCGTVVDIQMIFAIALECRAQSIILCHNHPSRNLKPSKCDLEITAKIKAASEFLDFKLLDHLIITTTSYTSFADEGWV